MTRSTSDIHIRVAWGAGATVLVLGLIATFGRALDFTAIETALPDMASISLDAAWGLTLVGIALACLAIQRKWSSLVAQACAVVIASLALLTLIGGVTHTPLNFDDLIFPGRRDRADAIPGGISPITAVCFVLFGAGIFTVRKERSRIVFLGAASLGLMLSILMIVGCLYGAKALYYPAQGAFAPLYANAALLCAFVGTTALRPDIGWAALFQSRGTGGDMARRLIPGIVILLPIVGLLKLQGHYVGLYEIETGTALIISFSVALLVGIVWFVAKRADVADEQMRASEQQYRNLVEEIREGIWIHADQKITFANAHAAKMLGARSAGDLVGMSVLDFVHKDDREHVANRIGVLHDEEAAVAPTEIRMLRLDKRPILVSMHSIRIIEKGRRYVMSTGHDITTQREAERQLRRSHRLQAVGQLTGGAAHEFNNILTIIMGNADLLAENVAHPSKRPELARAILEAATRGSDLTTRLLAFSRLHQHETQHVDANAFILGIEDQLKSILGENIKLRIRLGEGLWPLLVDPTQLELAILALVTNARDAMSTGGELTIETATAHLDEDYAAENSGVRPGDYVMVAVGDTGSGMSPDVLDRVFEPFFTTKEPGKGTGLGLSMVFGFAKQSAGHVKIHSEVDRGTLLKLYLPRADAPKSDGVA